MIVFAREHSRQFTYLCIIVVGLFLIYIGINTYKKYINKKGQDSYNMAYYTILKNMGPEVSQVELKQSEELFRKVIDKYGLSKAARLALPELAMILMFYLEENVKKFL